MEGLSLSERICYSTIRIEASVPEGVSTGTGFLFNFSLDQGVFSSCLVSNKHVIEGSSFTRLVVSCKDKIGNVTKQRLEIDTKLWILHPDEDTDLCVLPMVHVFGLIIATGMKPYVAPLDESLIPSKEQLENLSAIEDIIMVGYPDGIWDEVNNQPILRRGITATHPKNDFNGNPEFLIDAACFPGSSGSPVLILNQGSYIDKTGSLNIGVSRVLLLGVLYAGPQHTAEGSIRFAAIPRTYTAIPNNLGLVIKSHKLLDFKSILQEHVK